MSSERDCGANYLPPPKKCLRSSSRTKGRGLPARYCQGELGGFVPPLPEDTATVPGQGVTGPTHPFACLVVQESLVWVRPFPRPQQNYEPGDPSECKDAFFSRIDWFAARHKQVRRPRLVLVDGAPRRPHPQGGGGGVFHHWGGGGVKHSPHLSTSPRSRPGKELVQRVSPGGGICSRGNNGVSVCIIQ